MTSRVFRPLAVAVTAGALVGFVVAGAGARLAMGLIALADDRNDFGSITDSGAVVGEITTGGTIDVLVTGVELGILGALFYVGIRRWLPQRCLHAAIVFSIIVLGFGLLLTVEANRGDFVFLNTAVSMLSFAVVILLFGLSLVPMIERFAPRSSKHPRWRRAFVICFVGLAVIAGAFAIKRALDLADQDVQLTWEDIVSRTSALP